MQAIELSNAVWSLRLLPEWGGRVAALKAEGLDILLPVSSTVFNPLDWPRAGAYPLMPYCNRLKDARLSFAGQTYQLPGHPAAQPHTLHGICHTQAWEVVSADQQQVLIACTYQGPHWPWMFRAEQRFTLEGNCLRITLALVNLGDTDMPAGFGLHPYFQRHPGMRARYSRGREWLIDDQYLATGEFVDAVGDITLQADDPAAVAHYQSRWDGKLNLEYREGRMAINASSPLSHFVAFAPTNAPFVCLEPVSHLADAFNCPRSEWREVGTHVLEPGARLTANLDFEWHRH